MRKWVVMFLVVPALVWAVSAEQIVRWVESPSVTVADAVWLVESLAQPGLQRAGISWKRYAGLAKDAPLTAGRLSKILILSGRLNGGILYWITGWERYAFSAAQAKDLFGQEYVASRPLSGAEMVAVCERVQ